MPILWCSLCLALAQWIGYMNIQYVRIMGMMLALYFRQNCSPEIHCHHPESVSYPNPCPFSPPSHRDNKLLMLQVMIYHASLPAYIQNPDHLIQLPMLRKQFR